MYSLRAVEDSKGAKFLREFLCSSPVCSRTFFVVMSFWRGPGSELYAIPFSFWRNSAVAEKVHQPLTTLSERTKTRQHKP